MLTRPAAIEVPQAIGPWRSKIRLIVAAAMARALFRDDFE